MNINFDLLDVITPFLESNDTEGLTNAILGYPNKDVSWWLISASRLSAPSTTDEQRGRITQARDKWLADNHPGKTSDQFMKEVTSGMAQEQKSTEQQNKQTFLNTHNIEEISLKEALKKLNRESLFEDFDDTFAEFDEYEDDELIVFFARSDVHIKSDFSIPDINAHYSLLIVDGNLTIEGNMSDYYFVTGNAEFDTLNMNNFQRCLGTETVKYYQGQHAEDHEVVTPSRPRHISAQLFFSWFYDISAHTFSDQTQIFVLYDHDKLKLVRPQRPLFAWHEHLYALKPEFIEQQQEEHWHDYGNWEVNKMVSAVKQGESIYRDGFNPNCMLWFRRGEDLITEGDLESAFLHFKKACEISPSYYLAYEQAGHCLLSVGAYEQAQQYYNKGISYMPEKDCTPKFDCATLGALCLLISGQPKAAIVQCESALQRHSKTEHCHRVLGEAHLQLGNNEEALAALTVATTVDRDFPSLWLCGLAHHNLGNEKEADELLSKAKKHNKNAQDYSDAKDLSYHYTPATTVDWLNKDLDSYIKPSKDQVYWNELFLEKLHSTDLNELCALVPEEFRTLAMFEACVTPPKEEIRNFRLNGRVIKYFKHLPITKEIALKAVAVQSSTCAISDLPETLVDRSIYLATSWLPIKEIPEEYLDTEMYLHAVKKHSFNFTDVPREFKSDEIAVQAIASGFLDYDKNIDQMPKRYLEDEFLQQAIALDINAIDNLPAKLVNKQLFDFAQKKYSSEPAWQSILDKHHPSTVEDAHWSYRPREYLNKVWACFWTAASIELAVEEGASLHGISSDAFFSAHTILAKKLSSEKLDLVPRELLTQELCDQACNKSKYGSVIEDIPVAMRSAELCQKAVQKNSTNLRYVPLDHRTIKLCAIAYDDRSSNIAAIPYEIYIGVFDYLLKDPDSDWNEGHLYLMRGIGHFANNDYKLAISDFEKSRKNRIEISDESLLKSYYFQGWAHYKLNQTSDSLKNFALSQETDDKDELEYTEPYEAAKLPKVVVDIVDLNLPLFKSKLRRANGLMDAQYFDEALLELINLEKTLTEIDTVEELLKQSNCAAMILWAEIWECKVRCLSEMGHVADCVKLCQQRLDTLHSLKAFDYYPYTYDGVGYDLRPVYGAIRCMSAQLAKHCIEIGDLEKGLELSLQSIAPPNSGEHDETSYGFYEQHLENLLHASEFDKSYLSQLKRVYKSSTVRRLIKEDDIARNLVTRIKNKLEN